MNKIAKVFIVCFFISALDNLVHAQEASIVSEAAVLSNETSPKDLRKGSFTLGLNASGSGVNTINHSGKNWSLAPQVGYLVAHRLVVGFQVSMGKWSQKLKTGTPPAYMIPEYQFYSVLPEIYSRYYLLDFRLKPFVQLSSGYNFQWGNEQNGSLEASSDSRNFALSGAFGLSFRISRHVGLEALYNARFDNNSRILDANENLKYRLGISIFIL